MNEKCFCHFNGYEVKDAKARRDIDTINTNIDTINNNKISKDSVATLKNVVSRNLFNVNNLNSTYNLETTLSRIENGIRATALGSAQSKYSALELDKSLMGKTVTLSATITPSSTNAGALAIFFGTSSQPFLSDIHWFTESGSDTFTIPSTFPSGCDKLFMNVYSNGGGTGVTGAYVDYTNIQIEEGTTATDCVSYLNLEEIMKSIYPEKIYITNFIRIKQGFSFIDSDYIYKQGNRYFGDIVIKKNDGVFNSASDVVATLNRRVSKAINTGCFLAEDEWITTKIGYCYMGETSISIADSQNQNCSFAKIHLDIVVD